MPRCRALERSPNPASSVRREVAVGDLGGLLWLRRSAIPRWSMWRTWRFPLAQTRRGLRRLCCWARRRPLLRAARPCLTRQLGWAPFTSVPLGPGPNCDGQMRLFCGSPPSLWLTFWAAAETLNAGKAEGFLELELLGKVPAFQRREVSSCVSSGPWGDAGPVPLPVSRAFTGISSRDHGLGSLSCVCLTENT